MHLERAYCVWSILWLYSAFSQHVVYTFIEGAGQGGKMTWKQLTENDCHGWKLNVQQSIPKTGTTRDQV